MITIRTTVAFFLLAITTSATQAQTTATATIDAALAAMPPKANDLHFSFTPGVWLARLGGDVTLGPSPNADKINLENDFNLDDQDTAFNFEMYITKGDRWQIDASGFDFSTDSSGTMGFDGVFGDAAFSTGDAFSASFDMTSIAVAVSYWQWHPINSVKRDGRLDLRFSWGGGFRYLSVDQHFDLTATSTEAEGDGDWLVPELVMQLDMRYEMPESFPILKAFEVMGYGSVGPAFGGDGGMVVTLRAGMRFWLCQNASLDFGYRLLESSVESDDYEFEGGLQGLFLSGTIRF